MPDYVDIDLWIAQLNQTFPQIASVLRDILHLFV